MWLPRRQLFSPARYAWTSWRSRQWRPTATCSATGASSKLSGLTRHARTAGISCVGTVSAVFTFRRLPVARLFGEASGWYLLWPEFEYLVRRIFDRLCEKIPLASPTFPHTHSPSFFYYLPTSGSWGEPYHLHHHPVKLGLASSASNGCLEIKRITRCRH